MGSARCPSPGWGVFGGNGCAVALPTPGPRVGGTRCSPGNGPVGRSGGCSSSAGFDRRGGTERGGEGGSAGWMLNPSGHPHADPREHSVPRPLLCVWGRLFTGVSPPPPLPTLSLWAHVVCGEGRASCHGAVSHHFWCPQSGFFLNFWARLPRWYRG